MFSSLAPGGPCGMGSGEGATAVSAQSQGWIQAPQEEKAWVTRRAWVHPGVSRQWGEGPRRQRGGSEASPRVQECRRASVAASLTGSRASLPEPSVTGGPEVLGNGGRADGYLLPDSAGVAQLAGREAGPGWW